MNYIQELTIKEFDKQRDTLNLIASENYPSPKVIQMLGSLWSNKYGEGYPGKRYYAGNQYTDSLEDFVQKKALQVFDKTGEYGVNVQTLSGSPANRTVFLTVLQPGDKVLSPQLASGGHLTHMHDVSIMRKYVDPYQYLVKETAELTYEIDWEDLKTKIETIKPKLLIVGFSAYSKKYEFADICSFAHKHGCYVLADIAHINGLVASGHHPSPFLAGDKGADFVSMTTHKTMRGPRSAMLFAKNYIPTWVEQFVEELPKNAKGGNVTSLIAGINRALFPGGFGGPHFNKIAGMGQALLEILGEDDYPDKIDFKTYSQNTLDTCKTLETSLQENGLQIVSPTENHLTLVKFPDDIDSLKVQKDLEEVGIITNRNPIPFDKKLAYKPGGMRFGTAALTSRGLNNQHSKLLGKLICDIVFDKASKEEVISEVKKILQELNWWYT